MTDQQKYNSQTPQDNFTRKRTFESIAQKEDTEIQDVVTNKVDPNNCQIEEQKFDQMVGNEVINKNEKEEEELIQRAKDILYLFKNRKLHHLRHLKIDQCNPTINKGDIQSLKTKNDSIELKVDQFIRKIESSLYLNSRIENKLADHMIQLQYSLIEENYEEIIDFIKFAMEQAKQLENYYYYENELYDKNSPEFYLLATSMSSLDCSINYKKSFINVIVIMLNKHQEDAEHLIQFLEFYLLAIRLVECEPIDYQELFDHIQKMLSSSNNDSNEEIKKNLTRLQFAINHMKQNLNCDYEHF
ncbi:hypothetical protein TTHERM_00041440 (macronuclear) [Tetrahymena thermophila SB210]|uniref:Uncharacterized protein n=1 Tax=Tetrahymena thermophila (strain SB210) TaxID=312017 RepID=Q22LX3_TETTS|nr:hypothetical protein TTHERM_00041440 [Tetrahymena thermophila SB210]EAR86478.3 hypothetical protein TTHERM_00041440 [Tetrahymena thermophila SB210]|eukprot:XP_977247.3 hypothetical protein TTHERM_00041440 [Tetrahymena thermophila SB210]